MRTQADIKDDFLIQNQKSTTAAFYTDAILSDFIDKAHKYSAGFKKWPFTEGRQSTTFASLVTDEDGFLRGEFPEGWKPETIRLLKIGGKRLIKKDFQKFHQYFEENASADDRFFTDRGLNYYINPNIDLSGTVTVWGQYTPATIDATDDTAKTVFTDNAEEGNEAIVEFMLSYAMKREKKKAEALSHVKEGQRILNEIWDRIKDEQFDYEGTPDDGMFERIDVVEGALRDDLFKRDQFT